MDNVKIKQMAQIAADIGTGIGFANISAKSSDGKAKAVDGVCYSRSGHNTIYLSPDSVNSVEKITLEELAHAFEGTEGYSDIAKMATEYYDARPRQKRRKSRMRIRNSTRTKRLCLQRKFYRPNLRRIM